MERKLLLLGLLQMHEMYGYQLNEIIDTHFGRSIDFKKPTIYKLLGQMAEDGWLEEREEESGNRPTRHIYTITSTGRAVFSQLLRESLAGYKPADYIDSISLAFLDHLPTGEAITLLQQRRSAVERLLSHTQDSEVHPGSMQLMIEYQTQHLKLDLQWIDEIIHRLQQNSTPQGG